MPLQGNRCQIIFLPFVAYTYRLKATFFGNLISRIALNSKNTLCPPNINYQNFSSAHRHFLSLNSHTLGWFRNNIIWGLKRTTKNLFFPISKHCSVRVGFKDSFAIERHKEGAGAIPLQIWLHFIWRAFENQLVYA